MFNKVVLSILVTEAAERVAYFGFRSVLVLYFTDGLRYSESTSVSLCAATVALAYFSPLVGALLADSSWGRFRTIWRFGTAYAVGLCVLTLAAFQVVTKPVVISNEDDLGINGENSHGDWMDSNSSLNWKRILTFVGLILICIGTGGIKPCVSAFGADQVVLNGEQPSSFADVVDTSHTPSPSPSETELRTLHSKLSDMDQMAIEATTNTTGIHEIEGNRYNTGENPLENHRKQAKIREFFNSFYFCINVGALASFATIPIIRANYGFGSAFLIPTVSMIFALAVFKSQQMVYIHRRRDPSQPPLSRILQTCFQLLVEKWKIDVCRLGISDTRRSIDIVLGGGHHLVSTAEADTLVEDIGRKTTTSDQKVYHDACHLLHLGPLMLFFPVFWMLYDQQGSVWTLQATRLNLHGLEPEQLQFLNPLEIMIFIPLFDKIIYPWLEAHRFNMEPLKRVEYGMLLTALSFGCSAWLESVVQSRPYNTVSLAWQIPQITILTVAEILVNVTGLEFAYSQAPSRLQALVLAIFLSMTAIGDGLGALLFATVFRHINSTVSMSICAVCMVINMGFFSTVARNWKPYHLIITLQDNASGLEMHQLHAER